MLNYSQINSTPTVNQIKAIIEYMENSDSGFNFDMMMDMKRKSENEILLNLNNGGFGHTYTFVFNNNSEIINVTPTGSWMS